MKDVKNILANLESIKAGLSNGKIEQPDSIRLIMLESQLKELQTKKEQLTDEINREVEDFLDMLQLKEASLQLLSGMLDYIQNEAAKLEAQISKLKTQGEVA